MIWLVKLRKPITLVLHNLARSFAHIARSGWFISGLLLAVCAIVGVVIWSSGDKPPGMKTFSLKNGGYEYSVLFYAEAKPIRLEDDSNALVRGTAAVLSVKPVDAPAVTDCTSVGAGWSEAFKVSRGGTKVPVCSLGNGYATIIDIQGQGHLVTITFKSGQRGSADAVLQAIYSSLQVKGWPGESAMIPHLWYYLING